MELSLLTHKNTLGEEISKTLKSKRYLDFKVVVAYSRNSGIGRIYNDLLDFSNIGGKTSIIAGIDQKNTSYQALINLKTFAKRNLYIHHDRNYNITFHSKLYIFGNDDIEKIIIGSSNFTAGGLYSNYETNINIVLDSTKESQNLKYQISNYWKDLIEDENTLYADTVLLEELFKKGSIMDETKRQPFKDIIEKIYDLPFKSKKKINQLPPIVSHTVIPIPKIEEEFAMTLSGFDVSPRAMDPVLLIPLTALRERPHFWNFPELYTDSGAGYPQFYAIATVYMDNEIFKSQYIRIYYYERKKEFRLQCEKIKRNGNQGDIILIHKNYNRPQEFEIHLVRQNTSKYNFLITHLIKKASKQKNYGYF